MCIESREVASFRFMGSFLCSTVYQVYATTVNIKIQFLIIYALPCTVLYYIFVSFREYITVMGRQFHTEKE